VKTEHDRIRSLFSAKRYSANFFTNEYDQSSDDEQNVTEGSLI